MDDLVAGCVVPARDPALPASLEILERAGEPARWTFYLDHGDREVHVPCEGWDVLGDVAVTRGLDLAGEAVAVVRVPAG